MRWLNRPIFSVLAWEFFSGEEQYFGGEETLCFCNRERHDLGQHFAFSLVTNGLLFAVLVEAPLGAVRLVR